MPDHRRLNGLILGLAVLLVAGRAGSDAGDSSYASPGLRAASAAPWNPPAPVPAARPWETALRFPGRIVSLPIVALGAGTERGMHWAEEHDLAGRVAYFLNREGHFGVAARPASLGDRTGLGAELRWNPPPLHHHLSASVSASTHQYNRELVVASFGPVRASYGSDWRPREPYFGLGLAAPASGVSAYGERTQAARLGVEWEWQGRDSLPYQQLSSGLRPEVLAASGSPPRTRVRAWAGPREVLMTHGRDPDDPSIDVAHPADVTDMLDRRVDHFVYGAGLSHDARAGRPHWSHGWRASVDGERYDRSLGGLAFGDAHSDAKPFTRMSYRAEAAMSYGRDPRTLRLALHAIDQKPGDDGGPFLIRDLATLGGADLAGFEIGRFRDMDLMHAKLTYLYPLTKNFEADLHAETGGVYPRLGAARFETLRQSFGAALRLRSEDAMFAWVGFDWSAERTRLRFSLGDVQ